MTPTRTRSCDTSIWSTTDCTKSVTIWKRFSRMLPDASTTKMTSARPSQSDGESFGEWVNHWKAGGFSAWSLSWCPNHTGREQICLHLVWPLPFTTASSICLHLCLTSSVDCLTVEYRMVAEFARLSPNQRKTPLKGLDTEISEVGTSRMSFWCLMLVHLFHLAFKPIHTRDELIFISNRANKLPSYGNLSSQFGTNFHSPPVWIPLNCTVIGTYFSRTACRSVPRDTCTWSRWFRPRRFHRFDTGYSHTRSHLNTHCKILNASANTNPNQAVRKKRIVCTVCFVFCFFGTSSSQWSKMSEKLRTESLLLCHWNNLQNAKWRKIRALDCEVAWSVWMTKSTFCMA